MNGSPSTHSFLLPLLPERIGPHYNCQSHCRNIGDVNLNQHTSPFSSVLIPTEHISGWGVYSFKMVWTSICVQLPSNTHHTQWKRVELQLPGLTCHFDTADLSPTPQCPASNPTEGPRVQTKNFCKACTCIPKLVSLPWCGFLWVKGKTDWEHLRENDK